MAVLNSVVILLDSRQCNLTMNTLVIPSLSGPLTVIKYRYKSRYVGTPVYTLSHSRLLYLPARALRLPDSLLSRDGGSFQRCHGASTVWSLQSRNRRSAELRTCRLLKNEFFVAAYRSCASLCYCAAQSLATWRRTKCVLLIVYNGMFARMKDTFHQYQT